MLPKNNRADKKIIEDIFKRGRFINSGTLSFKYILNSKLFVTRISFIAPKTIFKKAVLRNSLRRRGYNALKKHLKFFPAGILGAFIFKKLPESILVIENEIKNVRDKIN